MPVITATSPSSVGARRLSNLSPAMDQSLCVVVGGTFSALTVFWAVPHDLLSKKRLRLGPW